MPVVDLSPYSGNARTHSRKQVRQIADSIERFGFTNPILIDDVGMILAGHGRAEAAKHLGLDQVPCLRLSQMSELDKRAYILADNKLAENAGWDEDVLAHELSFLLEESEVIDIGVTGFSIAEIDAVLEPGGTAVEADTQREDSLPTSSKSDEPITHPGDLWQLGDHRLICGNARDENAYQALMHHPTSTIVLADMVFTDPPYNVPVDGHGSRATMSCQPQNETARSFKAGIRRQRPTNWPTIPWASPPGSKDGT